MMTDQDLLDMALRTPVSAWDKLAERWIDNGPGFGYLPTIDNRGSMDDAVRKLDSLIEALTRFRAYLEYRSGSGCSDQGHKAAVKAQNSLAAKVRKALGFTYPKQDITF